MILTASQRHKVMTDKDWLSHDCAVGLHDCEKCDCVSVCNVCLCVSMCFCFHVSDCDKVRLCHCDSVKDDTVKVCNCIRPK